MTEPQCDDCCIPLIRDERRLCASCRRVEEKMGPRTIKAAIKLAGETARCVTCGKPAIGKCEAK